MRKPEPGTGGVLLIERKERWALNDQHGRLRRLPDEVTCVLSMMAVSYEQAHLLWQLGRVRAAAEERDYDKHGLAYVASLSVSLAEAERMAAGERPLDVVCRGAVSEACSVVRIEVRALDAEELAS